jgi:hypothetical protein
MEAFTPELIGSVPVTAGLGLLMVWLARSQNLVERRDEGKRCPSSGLQVRWDGSCGCTR